MTAEEAPRHRSPHARALAAGALAGLVLALWRPSGSALLLVPDVSADIMGWLQRRAGLPQARDAMRVVHAVVWGAGACALLVRAHELRLVQPVWLRSWLRWAAAGVGALAVPLLLLTAPGAAPPRALTTACTYGASSHWRVCPGLACPHLSVPRLVLLAPHRLLARASGDGEGWFYGLVVLAGAAGGVGARGVRRRGRA